MGVRADVRYRQIFVAYDQVQQDSMRNDSSIN